VIENALVHDDLEYILKNFEEKKALQDSTVLLTGCAGFLGFYFLHFFCHYSQLLGIKSIIGIDNFKLGKPPWLTQLLRDYPQKLQVHSFNVAQDDLSLLNGLSDVSFIIHMASIASPTFYRKYPLETIDANIWGLRKLFEFFKNRKIQNFLFFSSSEIYGDPDPQNIPTPEDFHGNVSCVGPRACYDESKRFGETLCYVYSNQYNFPVTIVRPFNNYGPGMKLDDRRVPADFAKAIFENRDIVIFSDGSPRRTFCYVADAIVGYLKALVYKKFDYFNIGIGQPEITMQELAQIYINQGRRMNKYTGTIRFNKPAEKEYLTHNPQRRSPDISKAKRLLNYHPAIDIEEGVRKFLTFIQIQKGIT